MKKTKLASIFLNVNKIISIIMIPIFAILAIVGIILCAFSGSAESDMALGFMIGYGAACAVVGIIFIAIFIIALILNNKARSILAGANSRKELNKAIVLSFITGALSTPFAIASAILMIFVKDSDFVIDVK